MYDEISDNRLTVMWQKYLSSSNSKNRLKGLRLCGSRTIKQLGTEPAIFILSSEKEARFFGHITCRNPWACPRCSAKVMSKKGVDIACAIDALAQKYNQYAFMCTYTIPHDIYMSCQESFDVLREAWRMFTKGGNREKVRADYVRKKTGEKVVYFKGSNIYGKWRSDLNITHQVRVYEFTWGENGWHPHIHALTWVPKKNLSKVLDYEKKLSDYWWHCIKHCALKLMNKRKPDQVQKNKEACDNFYNNRRQSHASFFISKNPDNSIRIQKSSHYITGWSGDDELTGGRRSKTARDGHYTPHQILVKAYENPDEREKWLKLHLEYANTVFKHRRVNFSTNSGIGKIIREWKKTNNFIQLLKKKSMDKAVVNWKVIFWFKSSQWSKIYEISLNTGTNLIVKILQLAIKPQAKQLINQLLLEYDIDCTQNKYHVDIPLIENEIFNKTA